MTLTTYNRTHLLGSLEANSLGDVDGFDWLEAGLQQVQNLLVLLQNPFLLCSLQYTTGNLNGGSYVCENTFSSFFSFFFQNVLAVRRKVTKLRWMWGKSLFSFAVVGEKFLTQTAYPSGPENKK